MFTVQVLPMFAAIVVAAIPRSISVLGFYLALRCFRFPDLTVAGSFVLGGSMAAYLTACGWPSPVTILVSSLSGIVCGNITAALHTKLKLPAFVSGIITTFTVTSLNFHLLGKAAALNGQAQPGEEVNYVSIQEGSVFSFFSEIDKNSNAFGTFRMAELMSLTFLAVVIFLAASFFLKSKKGLRLRGLGSALKTAPSYGSTQYAILGTGLGLCNGLVAFGGAVAAFVDRRADIESGHQILLPFLAAIVVGEIIIKSVVIPLGKKIDVKRRVSDRKEKLVSGWSLLSKPTALCFVPFVGYICYELLSLSIAVVLTPQSQGESLQIGQYNKYVITAFVMTVGLVITRRGNKEIDGNDAEPI